METKAEHRPAALCLPGQRHGAGGGTAACELAPSAAEWLSEQPDRPGQEEEDGHPAGRRLVVWESRPANRGRGAKGRGAVPEAEEVERESSPPQGRLSPCPGPGGGLGRWDGVGTHSTLPAPPSVAGVLCGLLGQVSAVT